MQIIQEIPIIEEPKLRKPEWLKAKVPGGENYAKLRSIMNQQKLHTVCEEARCPNMGECWNSGTATFMILGDTCTRSCGFCAVKTGKMHIVDEDEPRRVAEAVEAMQLRHAVITSVNRDELFDGGAHIFANTIFEIRKRTSTCRIEVLIPDFQGSEEALNIAETLARSNAIDVIVIDSVAALVPKSELEGDIGDNFVGLQARLMSQALRKLTAALSKSNTCAIFINQIREKIGVMYGSPETTTGGRALKFYASIRLDIRRIAGIKGGENNEIGNRVKVKVVKNKLAPPFQIAEFDIMFNEGISRTGTAIDLGTDLGIIDKKGAWFSYKGQRLGQGREAVRDELRNNTHLLEEIEGQIIQHLKDKAPQAKPAPASLEAAEELAEV